MNYIKDNIGIIMLLVCMFGINIQVLIQCKRASVTNAKMQVVLLEHQKALVEHANVIREIIKAVKK